MLTVAVQGLPVFCPANEDCTKSQAEFHYNMRLGNCDCRSVARALYRNKSSQRNRPDSFFVN